jgi:hypothetical protein
LSDEPVKLTEVATEAEAITVCGFLESQGIRAVYNAGGTSSGLGALTGGGIGQQQILVAGSDLEAAREALAGIEEAEPSPPEP